MKLWHEKNPFLGVLNLNFSENFGCFQPLTKKNLKITPAPRDIVMSGIAGIDTFVFIPKIGITMRYQKVSISELCIEIR